MLLYLSALIQATMTLLVPVMMMTTIQTMKIAQNTLGNPECVSFVEVIDGGTKLVIPNLSSAALNVNLMVCYLIFEKSFYYFIIYSLF